MDLKTLEYPLANVPLMNCISPQFFDEYLAILFALSSEVSTA